jgi:hypothetical protein
VAEARLVAPGWTEERARAVVGGGTAEECLALRAALVSRKKGIEAHLAEDRLAMQADRSARLRAGVDPRTAQVEATAETDFDWRSAAVTAQRYTDAWLSKVRSRLQQLDAERRPTRTVVIPPERLTCAADLAGELAALAPVYAVTQYGGSYVVVCGASKERSADGP